MSRPDLPLLQPDELQHLFAEFDGSELENREEEQESNSAVIPPNNDTTPVSSVTTSRNNNSSTTNNNPHAQAAAATVLRGRRVATIELTAHPTRRRVFRIPGSRVAVRHRTNGTGGTIRIPVVQHHHNHHNHTSTGNVVADSPPPMIHRSSRFVPVDALKPNPLGENWQIKHREAGDPRTIANNDDANDDEPFNDVELIMDCVICYETLIQPAGCGNCTARFCLPCLMTAMLQHRQCPVCRSDTRSEIILDAALQSRLEKYGVVCQYCRPETFDAARLYPIGVHRIPHVDCPDLLLECRLAPYGCPWRGPRRQLLEHNCAYEPISGFLEQFRQCQIHNEQSLQQVMAMPPSPHHQFTTTPRSVFPDLLQFVALLCTNPRLLGREVAWLSFVDARQNFEAALTCLPTVILQIKMLTTGFRQVVDNGINFENLSLVLLGLTCFTIVIAVMGICASHGNGWRPLTFHFLGREIVFADRRLSMLLSVAAFIPQWWAFHQTAKSSTIHLCLLGVTATIGTGFFSSSLANAANTVFATRERAVNNNACSRATLPIRSALVFALASQGTNVLSRCDGIMVCVLFLFPLLKRLGMKIVSYDDPMLSYLANTVTTADRMFIVTARFLISLSWTKASLAMEVLVACTMAIKWLLIHSGVLAIAWLGKKSALAILGRNGRSPMGLMFFCGWILCLYLLAIL